jgi:hypothetical protein
MPIPLPQLDVRRFADLVDEGRRLIPGLAPSWTDHNPSDPGITLIELFAFISEMLLYRANRVSEANRRAFVRLLRGPSWPADGRVDDEIRDAVRELRDEQRALTAADFVARAEAVPGVARAWCLARRNLESGAADAATRDAPAHVSVVVVAQAQAGDPSVAVATDLAPRCLLTTRLHVVLPRYLTITVNLVVVVNADRDSATMARAVFACLLAHFDPLTGGQGGMGWPLGRAVYASELLALLDALDGVDYVTPVPGLPLLDGPPGRTMVDPFPGVPGEPPGLRADPDELVRLDVAACTIRIVRLNTLVRTE